MQILELPEGVSELKVRLEKIADGLCVWFDDGKSDWRKLREVAYFFHGIEDKTIKIGTYASRPSTFINRTIDPLQVEFEALEIF